MENKLSHKGFIGSVNFNPDDRIFYGKTEGINDLVTFEGTTVEKLENAFKSMVEEHMNDCKQEGRSVGKS